MDSLTQTLKSMGLSIVSLANEAGMSKQQMNTILKKKRPATNIALRVFNKYGILSVVNPKVNQKVNQLKSESSSLASILPDSSMVERAAVNR
jgi:hypothetical protein